jgi:hypothetical protein
MALLRNSGLIVSNTDKSPCSGLNVAVLHSQYARGNLSQAPATKKCSLLCGLDPDYPMEARLLFQSALKRLLRLQCSSVLQATARRCLNYHALAPEGRCITGESIGREALHAVLVQ